MEKIMKYIFEKYDPSSIILYGSYANKTNNTNSDFDVLVISNTCQYIHDTSFVDDIQLDLFVYPKSYFKYSEIDFMSFVQIFDGKIVYDSDKIGMWLKKRVNYVISSIPYKNYEENKTQIEWCEKMLARSLRKDPEGYYRLHWVLVDSLEIYFDICSLKYYGPKKSLSYMKKKDPVSHGLYAEVLEKTTHTSLEKWIHQLRNILEKVEVKD
ncbi:nucleotidyltransferase [Enterococcus faecalis]|nr:nucleotidyltransferase [Enterococcus faecalis]